MRAAIQTTTAVTQRLASASGNMNFQANVEHLVVAEARQRPADEDLEAAHTKTFTRNTPSCVTTTAPCGSASVAAAREREARVGHVRQVVAAEEERGEERADDRDLDELREHEEPHLHGAVLGVVAGDQLAISASGRSKGMRLFSAMAAVRKSDGGEGLVDDAPGRQEARAPCPTAAARSRPGSTVP